MLASLRSRRAVFWYLAADRIVAAVVAKSDREPVLEACAASYGAPVPGACFAPGVTEVAWVLGCRREAHVAALGMAFCRIVANAEEAEEAGGAVRRGRIRGAEGVVVAEEKAVAEAASLFRRSRLPLLALDCESCALSSLAESLGTADIAVARRQHLSAVAVHPDTESTAEALGEDLAVPVGLAVGWFGAGRAH